MLSGSGGIPQRWHLSKFPPLGCKALLKCGSWKKQLHALPSNEILDRYYTATILLALSLNDENWSIEMLRYSPINLIKRWMVVRRAQNLIQREEWSLPEYLA
jgi:hypothetical protein